MEISINLLARRPNDISCALSWRYRYDPYKAEATLPNVMRRSSCFTFAANFFGLLTIFIKRNRNSRLVRFHDGSLGAEVIRGDSHLQAIAGGETMGRVLCYASERSTGTTRLFGSA